LAHQASTGYTTIIIDESPDSAGSARPGPVYRGATPVPVYGPQTLLVILVDFPDKPHTKTKDEIAKIFSDDLNRYFMEVSYGKISIRANVTDWMRLGNSISFYGQDISDDIDHNRDQLIWDAMRAALPKVQLAQYKHFMVLHAGYGQESSGTASDIWSSHRFGFGMNVGGAVINDVSVVPEFEAKGYDPLGVYAHEFAHSLGLPDLYDVNYKEDFLGRWDLMSKGNTNGNPAGSSPSHPSAWSKIKLGWITQIYRVPDGARAGTVLAPQEVLTNKYQAIVLPVGEDRYYLVEARDLIGYDRALPSAGVLITYVDEQRINGIVRVVNSKPTLRGLNDAPLQVGQSFNDTRNNIYLKVYSQNATGYGILVDRRGPLPDLTVQSVNLSPSAPKPKQKVTITVVVRNHGSSESAPTALDLEMDGRLLGRLPISSLKPGQSATLSIGWNATGGTHRLKVLADSLGKIEELDRSNNEYLLKFGVGFTLTLSLDTVLTVQIPGNATLSIDGIPASVDQSGSVQVAVPEGEHTIQAPRSIRLGNMSQLYFDSWSDGDKSNVKRVNLSDDLSLSVRYRLQNLLSVVNGQGCVRGEGWYDSTVTANLTVSVTCRVQEKGSRLLFAGWEGDVWLAEGNASIPMDTPHQLRANWKTQYYVDVVSPGGAGSGWYESGSRATVSVTSPIYIDENTRHLFVEWKGYGSSTNLVLAVDGPKRLEAIWRPQNKIYFKIDGVPPEKFVTFKVNGKQYNVSTPLPASDWFDSGQKISFTVSPAEMKGLWSMFQLKEFQDSSGRKVQPEMTVSGPTTITAIYVKRLCFLGLCFHAGWTSGSLFDEPSSPAQRMAKSS